MKSINKNRDGFTLIELIVIIVIIGILVLLATPKFLNYIEEAKLTNIIHDTKVVENMTTAHLVKFNGELPVEKNDLPIDKDELMEKIRNKKVYSKGGLLLESNSGLIYAEENTTETHYNPNMDIDFYLLDKSMVEEKVRTRLKGNFIVNTDGEAMYLDEINKPEGPGEEPEEPKDPEETEECQYDDPFKVFRFRKIKDGFNNYHLAIVGFTDEYLECIEDRPKFITIPEYVYSSEEVIEELEDYEGETPDNLETPMEVKTNTRKDEERHYSVVKIGDEAFYNNGNGYNIQGLRFENPGQSNRYLKEIGVRAFAGNNISGNITSPRNMNYKPNIPRSVKLIDDEAFMNNKLTEMRFLADEKGSNERLVIGKRAFANNKMTKIGSSNTVYDGIYLPNRLELIKEEAFVGNNLSGSFYIPEKLGEIGTSAFKDNDIKGIYLRDRSVLKTIDRDAFYNNRLGSSSIDYILNLPKSLEVINNGAFSMNKDLNLVRIHHGINHQGVNIESNAVINNVDISNIPSNLGFKDVYDSASRVETVAGIMTRNQDDSWKYKWDLPEYIFTFSDPRVDETVGITGFTDEFKEKIIGEDSAGNISYRAGIIKIPSYYETVIDGKYEKLLINTIEKDAFYNNGTGFGIEGIRDISRITKIGNSAFKNNEIKYLEYGSSLKEIGDYAFENNEIKSVAFTSIMQPNTIEIIGTGAFDNNNIGPRLNLPSSLKEVKDLAFRGNPELEEVYISRNIAEIKNTSFPGLDFKDVYDHYNNSGMTLIRDEIGTVEDGHWKLYIKEEEEEDDEIERFKYTFDKKNKVATIIGFSDEYLDRLEDEGKLNSPKKVRIPFNKEDENIEYRVENIGEKAFYNSGKGYNIYDLEAYPIKNIGERAFANNSISGRLSLPNINNIGKEAFANISAGNNNIVVVSIAENSYVGEKAFSGNNMKMASIGNNTEIHIEAFRNNPDLEEVTIGENVIINDGKNSMVFPGLDFKDVYDNANMTGNILMKRDKIGTVEDGHWEVYVEAEVDPIDPGILITDMFIYRKPVVGSDLVLLGFNPKYISGKENLSKEIFIPERVVEKIGDYNRNYDVVTINKEAFYNNGNGYNIKRVEIPYSISTIGDSSFEGNSIESLALGSKSSRSIKRRAFANNKIRNLVIPEQLSIAEESFMNNNLETLLIRKKTSIASKAFYDNDLSNITIEDSVSLNRDSIPGENFKEAYDARLSIDRTILLRDGELSNTKGRWTEPIIIDSMEGKKYAGGNFIFSNFKNKSVDILGFREEFLNRNIGREDIKLNVPKYVVRQLTSSGEIDPNGSFTEDDIYIVEKIGDSAFTSENYKIKELDISDGIKLIGKSAFEGNKISRITKMDSIEEIGENAFRNSGLTGIEFGPNLRKVSTGAFLENNNIEELRFWGDIENISFGELGLIDSLRSKLTGDKSENTFIVDQEEFMAALEDKISGYSGPTNLCRIGGVTPWGIGIDYVDGIANGLRYSIHSVDYLNRNAILLGQAENDVNDKIDVPDYIVNVSRWWGARNIPVKEVRADAFANNNTKLKEVTFSKNMNIINDRAFKNSGLEYVELHEDIKEIKSEAFMDNNIINKIDENGKIIPIRYPKTVDYITTNIFKNNKIEAIEIGNSSQIYSGAFENNNIKHLELPNRVGNIGENAFNNNDLEYVYLNDSLYSIRGTAFRNNPNLNHVSIFKYGTSNIRDINNKTFPGTNFYNSYLSNVKTHRIELVRINVEKNGEIINEEVSEVYSGQWTLGVKVDDNNEGGLFKFKFNDQDKTASILSFASYTGDSEKYTIIIPEKVIKDNVVYDITEISDGAFELESNSSVKIRELIISDNLRVIGNRAFKNNNIFGRLDFNDKFERIGDEAFAGNPDMKVFNIPKDIEIGKNLVTYSDSFIETFNDSKYHLEGDRILIARTNGRWGVGIDVNGSYSDGRLQFKQEGSFQDFYAVLLGFDGNYSVKASEDLIIPSYTVRGYATLVVNRINHSAFYDESTGQGKNISKLIIPKTMRYIYSNAFNSNNIEEVEISNITNIPEGLFANNKIKKLKLENITNIGDKAFDNNNLKEVEIPDSIEKIGQKAFRNNPELVHISIYRKNVNNLVYLYSNSFPGINFKKAYDANMQQIRLDFLRNDIEIDGEIIGDETSEVYSGNWGPGLSLEEENIGGVFKFELDEINKTASILGFRDDYDETRETNLILPEEVIKNGNRYIVDTVVDGAFEFKDTGIGKIRSLSLGKNIKYIGDSAFKGNNISSKIVIGPKLDYIGEEAFYNNNALNHLEINRELNMGPNAFSYFESLNKAIDQHDKLIGTEEKLILKMNGNWGIGKKVNGIGGDRYTDGQMDYYRSGSFGSYYTTIEGFNGNYQLKENDEIIIPDYILERTFIYRMNYIGSDSFNNVDGNYDIRKVYLPRTVSQIYHNAFKDNNIEELIIAEGLGIINEDVFNGNNLTSVRLPNSLSIIKKGAFTNNPDLVSLSVYNSKNIISNMNSAFPGKGLSDTMNSLDKNKRYNLDRIDLDENDKNNTGQWILGSLVEDEVKRYREDKLEEDSIKVIENHNEDNYDNMDIVEKTIRKTSDKIKSIFK